MLIKVVLFCAFFQQSLKANLPESLEVLQSELVHICEDLVQQTSNSRTEFWFFKESDVAWYAEELSENLIVSEPFVRYPKLLLDENGGFDGSEAGIPTLAFVFLGSSGQGTVQAAISTQLLHINIQTRLIVVFSFVSMNHLFELLNAFKGVRLLNVLYITVYTGSYHYEMFNFLLIRNMVQTIQRYESLLQIFPEQIELEGQIVDACTHHFPNYSELDAIDGKPKGLDVQLVNVIIRQMNGTLNIIFVKCTPEEKVSECKERMLDPSGCFLNFGRWQLFTGDYGVPAMPFYSLILLVPRGRPFIIYELLTAPFTLGVWSLIILFAIIRVFKKLVSTYSSCGLKNSRKKTIENLIAVGRNILTFILLCTYEAKIVSFLANWPNKPDITSIEELRSRGVQVVIETYLTLEEITSDSRLTGIVHPIMPSLSFDIFSIAHNTGILLETEVAKAILRKLPNYEHKTSRTRFVILDERVDTSLMFYFFGYRNILMHRFSTLLRYLYEAGIDQHWLKIDVATPEYSSSDESSTRMITFEQLMHWELIFKSLWILSIIVFCLEITCSRFAMLWRKVRHFKIGAVPVSRGRAQTYPLVYAKRRPKSARKSI